MGKLFLFMMVSLDGYIEGENHDLSWHNVDSEFNEFAAKQMQEMDAILFGRKTYELMHSYWPSAESSGSDDALVAQKMDTLPKIVVSHSLKNVAEEENWKNSRLIQNNTVDEIKKVKENYNSVAVLGSNNLSVTLLENNLLDEIRIMINPVVIGKGTPLFSGIQKRYQFNLTSSKQFQSGNVLLIYSR